MIEKLYLYLILTGITIGVVLLYLWREARNATRINLALIRLNEQLNFDTPRFLREAWALLSQSGLRGMIWRLDWFGIPVEGNVGQAIGVSLRKEIHVAEMKLSITLYRKNTRGERRYFDETLIETFLLLLRTDMWIKAGATDATFAQMAKLNLFLQHDMKNIAQFIQLMADQLAMVPAGKEQQVLVHLRTAAPLMRQRADRIVSTLTAGQAQRDTTHAVQLRDKLVQTCSLYQLDHTITGSARINVPEGPLDSALDNILKNYSDITLRNAAIRPNLSIAIQQNESNVDLVISSPNAPLEIQFERLFEPFWSSHPAGLGIGLYQAKQMLEMCDATLLARQTEAGELQFHIRFRAR